MGWKIQTKLYRAYCIAGLSVGITVAPQGIAYAIVVGLPPQVRLEPIKERNTLLTESLKQFPLRTEWEPYTQ